MADLSRFWRNQRAVASAEYDQKAMLAREMIYEHFDAQDSKKIRDIIDHFANDQRAMISLMGVLAQVGLMSLVMDDCGVPEEDD